MRYVWLALAAFLSANAMAANKEYSFFVDESKDKLCLSLGRLGLQTIIGTDAQDRSCSSGEKSVRIRILDAPEDASFPKGIYLERPFVIVDGIDLSTVEKRTITDLESDLQQVGLPNILKTLGYTPVLVQFTETVRRSLQQNSDIFSRLLAFLNDNKHIPFPGAKEEGFVIMGISQGGVIGRYGAYLYDSHRKPSDAPIRLFSSLDSPHQGAVMPMGLFSTVAFWSKQGASSAEMFKDMLQAKGAEDLLVYDNQCVSSLCYSKINVNSGFLFDDYRKAAEYKGFPSVLIAQGQLKGVSPVHKNDYYRLERHVEKGPFTLGSAISRMHYSDNGGVIAYNRKKEGASSPNYAEERDTSKYDFIQCSTYPFGATIYNAFREGFLDAIPNGMTKSVLGLSINLDASWGHDELIQDRSTFIPTVSAMDLKCNGNLAIRSDCGFTQSYNGFPFENPGNRSTAVAAFAVDPTHPRYNEPISGRHIESPVKGDKIDQNVLAGMQTDVWRVLCEVAKYDYDAAAEKFRNPKLNGVFSHKTSCMDQSKIPDIIKNAGAVKTRKIAYARYDFNSKASESDHTVPFTLPAGWQKVATFNIPDNIPAGSAFEIDISVKNPKSNWMKAELLMVRDARGNGQIQLTETDVPQYGIIHTLRWVLPNTGESVIAYKWLRLVLNSNGGDVVLYKPRIVTSSMEFAETPAPISSATIFPATTYKTVPWSDKVALTKKLVGTSEWLYVSTEKRHDGFHFDLGKAVSMDKFASLVVEFEPGTCTHTEVYFDAKDTGTPNLGNYSLQNDIANKILPLSKIIKTDVTPNHSLSASRLKIQATADNETCNIKAIYLQ